MGANGRSGRLSPRLRRTGRRIVGSPIRLALLAVVVVAPLLAACNPPPGDTTAYPDLVSLIPPGDFQIIHPTAQTKEFDYEHVIFNAGSGPLEIQPVNYNPATNLAGGIQKLFRYDASGNRVLAKQVATKDSFFYHALHGHFHFPMATFGLYGVQADGSRGLPVALSPKNGFCIADSTQVDPSLVRPTETTYNGGTCTDPNAVRGISAGFGDLYNRADPGQSIDITGVPDGTYWFHSVVDPGNNFQESNEANNTTDVKLRIQGDVVTPVNPLMSQGAFIIDKSFVEDGITNQQSTPPFTTANAGDLLVAFVAADGPAASPQSSTVSGAGLSWSLARRSNTQDGTAEIWTAKATGTLTNAVVSSTLTKTGGPYNHTMTVLAIKGAAGIGATAGANAGSGAPSASLTTTKTGAWVIGVGNDPAHWIPRVAGGGQTMVDQWFGEDNGKGTYWVQGRSAPSGAAGTTITINDSYRRGDPWNLSVAELVPAQSNDTTPPTFSAGAATNVGPDYTTVTWATNEPATSQLDYGTTPAYGTSTPVDPTLVTSHARQLSALNPSTTYYCRLRSVDAAGNVGVTAGPTFTTTPPRTTPPVFSAVTVPALLPDQALFAWTTDEPATAQVEYGLTTAYGGASQLNSTPTTAHFALVTGLSPTTTYHFRALGTDPYGNAGASPDQTFRTPAIPPPIAIDRTVSQDGGGVVTTPALSTASADELLVAFVASDGGSGGGQTATVSGGGLTWTLVKRANARPGTSEVWKAIAPSTLTNATFTSTLATGSDQSLTVVAFQGAVGIGASSSVSAASGGPLVTLSTTRTGSLIYGVGNDWDGALGRSLGAGQSLVHQWVDSAAGDTFWSQTRDAATGAVESVVTLDVTAPTTHQWNFVGVEVVRPVSVPG